MRRTCPMKPRRIVCTKEATGQTGMRQIVTCGDVACLRAKKEIKKNQNLIFITRVTARIAVPHGVSNLAIFLFPIIAQIWFATDSKCRQLGQMCCFNKQVDFSVYLRLCQKHYLNWFKLHSACPIPSSVSASAVSLKCMQWSFASIQLFHFTFSLFFVCVCVLYVDSFCAESKMF